MLDNLSSLAVLVSCVTRSAQPEGNTLLHRARATCDRTQSARYVLVLGASFGGPEAMVEFLGRLPSDVPASLVYVQHIDDYCAETLVQVMARNTALGVRMLGDGDTLIHGEVGVVPVSSALQFRPLGKVAMNGDDWRGPFSPSIDQVSIAVAEVYRERAGLIVFSGMGDDGAAACPRVKGLGGRVWVQAPASCVCPAMPDSALASGCVERVATPRALADCLLDYHRVPVRCGI